MTRPISSISKEVEIDKFSQDFLNFLIVTA